MTGILIATHAEASPLLRLLKAVKDRGIYHYRGEYAQRNVALYILRVGVGSKEQLRRFLRLYPFDAIIHVGAAASLTATLTHAKAVHISEVCAPGEKNLVIAPSGTRAVSVRHLVINDSEKADLRAQTGADVLDMETFTVAQIMAEREFSSLPYRAVRVIDDLPGEERYLQRESELRDAGARLPRRRWALSEILRFGLWDFIHIQWRRRKIATEIYRQVKLALAVKSER